jgi:hypothetical protein
LRPGAGKNKGSEYERTVGYKLSLWLSGGQRKDLLCRTVGSGAQFTFAKTRNQIAGIPGDLRSQAEEANKFCNTYTIECKHWRDLEIIKFLNGEGELYEALKKVQGEATQLGKNWMLVARQNRRPDILLTGNSTSYGKFHHILPCHLLFNEQVVMYQLDEFLKAVTPEMLLDGEN